MMRYIYVRSKAGARHRNDYMESILRDYNSTRKRNFGVGIILPDRYFHIIYQS